MTGELKPILTADEYEEALAEVKCLWGAKLGTADGDRLDRLVDLIVAYESIHYPMEVPKPDI